ncbi:DUF2199 domain-containing protein [Piscinibacter gummiphilus]|uniref:DUF2199 domain-containing protein n=1 Tax=Piscinibacter gummiphilus TaxID=946333 RepID=A0ABZ0CVF7_9BURK|nr:DUF2199 domain-containing protein [Piscinibacter gummiphilus]WOB06853.1 DUF2199 domain-containing protein [Piscinibacter gummiphilus]WOB06956.1 DUF2199 domain-containing protein [Piscinibacter gummiphilus]
MTFRFKCATCDEVHEGMPTFGAKAPLSYFEIPEEEREARCDLGSDDCVIDEKFFFVRGCIDIPVQGQADPFSWGVWVSLSRESHLKWIEYFGKEKRSHIGPFFGWLNAWLSPYPDTVNLKTRVHLRDDGIRPYIELEPTDHPLAVEQREGISVERVAEIYSLMVHRDGA